MDEINKSSLGEKQGVNVSSEGPVELVVERVKSRTFGALSGMVPDSWVRAIPRPLLRFIPASWWWWWEIGASIISVLSSVMLLALLGSIRNTRVDDWSLSIQPNSLISVFTTAAKTSMMVSVTSCISQLKWRHYFLRPDRLDYLQVFDEASRGPWGAFTALWRVGTKALIMMALALTTLLALGVEPMAQQILDLSERSVRLDNDTAEISMAFDYESASFTFGSGPGGFFRYPPCLAVSTAKVIIT
jgi:hypothetical protein